MPDSKDKHRKICDLMLEAEYMTPLWYTLKQEADRLEDSVLLVLTRPPENGGGDPRMIAIALLILPILIILKCAGKS